jgi:hypothetical protein
MPRPIAPAQLHPCALLLAADAEPVAETSAPPSLGKALFSTLGWPEDLVELASNGQPIISLLDEVCPQLAADIPRIAPWVMGGWLGGAPLAGLRARLQSDLQAMGRPIKEVADRLSLEMSLDRRHLEEQIRAGQTALRTAVAVVPDDSVIWLVRD